MTESEETIVTVSFMDDDETATSTDTSNVLSEAADTVAPVVSDDNISVTGGSGTNGAFVSGDTVTVTWDNTELTGDANFDTIESVEVTFFGEYDVEATEDESVWTATLAIDDIEGTVEDDELGIVVRAYDDAGNSSSDDVGICTQITAHLIFL